MLLDFCLAEIGSVVYNQAIGDAQKYFQERTTDLDAICHQPEFTYWRTQRASRACGRQGRVRATSARDLGHTCGPMSARVPRPRARASAPRWRIAALPVCRRAGALPARIFQVEDARELSARGAGGVHRGAQGRRTRASAPRRCARWDGSSRRRSSARSCRCSSDADPGVRQAAAVAAANAAQGLPGAGHRGLTKAMGTAPPADWAVFAASLGRISLPDRRRVRRALEQAIAAGLPRWRRCGPRSRARHEHAWRGRCDPLRVEGAARGPRGAGARERQARRRCRPTPARGSFAVVEAQQGTDGARAGPSAAAGAAGTAQREGGRRRPGAHGREGSRRRGATPGDDRGCGRRRTDSAAVPDADREAVLRAGIKDVEPRVRLEALRGWGRHLQARDCQPIVAAVADRQHPRRAAGASTCSAPAARRRWPCRPRSQKAAEALPPSGATLASRRPRHRQPGPGRPGRRAHCCCRASSGIPTWQVRMYAARARRADGGDRAARAARQRRARQRARGRDRGTGAAEAARGAGLAYEALTRPDYQLVMTAARTLAAETDKPKATAASDHRARRASPPRATTPRATRAWRS